MTSDKKLFPLSLPQETFYYDYLLNRDDCKYTMCGACILDGDLNVELYRNAYEYVIRHYDAMGIKFVKKRDIIYQEFRRENQSTLYYFDYSKHKNPTEEVIDIIIEGHRKPLPIESDELYSETIFRIDEKKFIISIKFHHLITDAMGAAIVRQAISDTYNSLLENGRHPDLQQFSYVDFIDDDLRYRNSDACKKSFEYWKQKYLRLPDPFGFTSKKISIKNGSLHTERLTLNLHRVCYESIVKIALETDATTFQVIVGLLAVVLNKCYNRKEFVIGMPVLNRNNYKFKNTPGLFMNMMPLRLKINHQSTFPDIVRSIKAEVRECYRHERFPLKDLIKHLRSNPEFNNELFDVTIVYRKMDFSQYLGGSKQHTITLDTETRNESLSIEIDEYDQTENVNVFYNYNPLVISTDEMTRFVHCFENILMDLIHFPEKTVKELSLLNEFDVHAIIHDFNTSHEQIVTRKTIVESFEEIVNRKPDALAVVHNDTTISYEELNRKANRTAHYLLSEFAVGPEEIICLASDRSIDAIAVMIGIMKAGAAYLPIDPDYPVERIRFIVENSGSRILLDNGSHGKNTAEVVVESGEIVHGNDDNVTIEIKPDNLAYVIYTSGSTGKPKGVLIEHVQFMNMFVNMIGKYGIKETDRVLQFASPGFDASLFEIFQALLTGATLVIADKELIQDVASFSRYLEETRVTVATLPPAYLKILNKAQLPSLTTLITAGEPAVADDVNFYRKFKRYINGYGPTETSVCTSYYIAEKDKEYTGTVPIGRPSPNSKIFILNDYLEPVPIGFEGELCVSGPSLARGYLNNEELTKQKFINNPFDAGTRLYRTGDRARWRYDGNIEFLGRIDEQVKIKGNRVELYEIENRLAEYDSIQEVAVLAVQRGDENELAAYIRKKQKDSKIEIQELKRYLRKFLPEYMIPLHYQFIENIPITQNGKINKEVLRKIPLDTSLNRAEFRPAVSEIECRLIKLFEEVLDVRPVGTNDNFFELGGESLKITRLISRIYKEFHREVGFRALFDYPTVRSIAAELDAGAVTEYESIPAAPAKEYYLLSNAQKRLWILTHDKENAACYHMPISLYLEGPLNLSVLEESLKKLVRRHESLRTTFIDINGTPYQHVQNEHTFAIDKFDVSDTDDAVKVARKLVKEKILVPFDLTKDVLLHADCIKIGKDRHALLLVLHHIAGDGISIGILIKELSEEYNAAIDGRDCKCIPLKIQYKDYCEYESDLIESRKYKEQKQYWIDKLKNPLPVLELIYNKMRPPIKTYPGDHSFYTVEKTISEGLFDFCKERQVSLYVMMVAIVNILLHKYSSQEEIIVGSPVSGRNHPDLDDQVGIYINSMALRNRIDDSQRFIDFLNEVQANATEALSNSDYPFDLLIQSLNLPRDTSRTPLFDVLVQVQNQNYTDLKLNGISVSFFEAEYKLSKFDLTFTFVEKDQKINFTIGYNTDLFDKTRIDGMSRHFTNIVTHILEQPTRTLNKIDLLNAAEKDILIKLSSGNNRELKGQMTIPELFEEQVYKTPHATALIFKDKKYTYNELNRRANMVAHAIGRKIKVNPDDTIAIMTSRSDLMIVGILGIVKAGAAYMPVDPDYPLKRISFMLQDSKTKGLLTESKLYESATDAAELNESNSCHPPVIIDISALSVTDDANPVLNITSSNLVYVIYTSGSTGNPKGVMIEHHSLYNLVRGLSDALYPFCKYPLNIALVAPFVFDASVKQIYYALLHGHCLDIVPDEIKTSGRRLLEFYEEHAIDVSDGTPVHLEILLEELHPGIKKYLPERFIIGGQQLMHQTVKKFLVAAGDTPPVITNVYGPTECCDVSTYYTVTPESLSKSEDEFTSLPIGKPLNNIQVLILDSNNALVPVGVRGELCITGEGLGRGYRNRRGQDENKFTESTINTGTRMYKTGDIGHYLSDGNIVLSGRTDDQIKLRGYRIELHEIENCMKKHDKINVAAVITVGEGDLLEIAAYYCAAEKIESVDLHQFLSVHLPAYMIPAYFILMEKLPLTLNGKVDKQSLPVPVKEITTNSSIERTGDYIEDKLCGIWRDLLHTERIAITDNFFNLGGHSLIAIRLSSRIHKEFNVEINIWEVFKHSTILSLAALVRSKKPSIFKPIEKIEECRYYALSHPQRRMWFLSRLEGQNSLYNLPMALHIKGMLNVHAMENAFNAIVQRHESLRTYFVEIDGVPFQQISDNVEFKIETTGYSGKEWDIHACTKPADDYFEKEFDLSKAPLLQCKLIPFSDDNYLFLFNMHHIISDGWSIEVMIKEFQILYDSFLNNSEIPLQPLRIQYKDYALWQNRNIEEKLLDGMKAYWHKKLSEPRPVLDIPTDYNRPALFTVEGNLLLYSLDDGLVENMKKLSTSRNASLYMALLSAVYILLHKYSGEEDIMVGSPVAGRRHYDLDNQIGLFINTVVLRNEVNPEKTFLELLSNVKEMLGEALDNEVYPFDLLVDELAVERIQNRNPIFDVMVAWMVKNGMKIKFSGNGMEAAGLDIRIAKSMFDLTFLFNENDGKISYAIEYKISLFKQERIQRLSEHFVKILESIISNPMEKIKNLEIIPGLEKERLLFGFNDVTLQKTIDNNVVDCFDHRVRIHPATAAMICEGRMVSYGELYALSNRIANHILEHCMLRKDDIIAVMVDDPVLAAASAVAVMKTGAAYLPIMSDNPMERIAFILKDSNAKAVVVDNDLFADGRVFSPNIQKEILILNIREKISENESSPENKIESDSLSYVIYTSGSTGMPKGVMIEHGSFSNLISSLYENIYSRYTDTLHELMISSFAFDVSIKQIFATICNGNTLHMVSKEKRLDPHAITNYLIQQKINIVDVTPSFFAIMLEVGFNEIYKPDLKELFLGSEALPFKYVKNFYGYAHNTTIHISNFYGPTECCVESAFYRFNPDMIDEPYDIAPIGKPVKNTQIYILDKYLNLCPMGVPGEICIAGKGLSRQYLNDPEKTMDKFVQFPTLPGTRIYKTGDLGRIRTDGLIEFLGRMDEQVKLRGYRIELQEIEKNLRELEGIKECIVILFEHEGSSDLTAYYTSDNAINETKLRNHLGRFLPGYMIPAYFVQIDKMPLSANGKVDKKLLPDPTGLRKIKLRRMPIDEIEKTILRICSTVLKNEEIGLEDNLFTIGGNSLNAVRILSRLRNELNVELPLKDIFTNPVIIDIVEKTKMLIDNKNIVKIKNEEKTVVVPISDDELELLSNLRVNDEY